MKTDNTVFIQGASAPHRYVRISVLTSIRTYVRTDVCEDFLIAALPGLPASAVAPPQAGGASKGTGQVIRAGLIGKM